VKGFVDFRRRVATLTRVIEVRGLGKVYQGPKGAPFQALGEVSFDARPGRVFGLLGPNGAGKTTTLRILSTVLRPTTGTARVAGFSVAESPREVRARIGFLSSSTGLYERLTPRETLEYFGRLHGLDPERIERRRTELFRTLAIEPFADQLCGTLSTGQKQKVSIARALVHEPPVLIFDEPTTGLDVLVARAVLDTIAGLRSESRTIILSTHILSEVERLCDDVAVIHHGRLLACGTKDEVKAGKASVEEAFFDLVTRAGEPAA
jgi:sodium transport system ATP-binding protein